MAKFEKHYISAYWKGELTKCHAEIEGLSLEIKKLREQVNKLQGENNAIKTQRDELLKRKAWPSGY